MQVAASATVVQPKKPVVEDIADLVTLNESALDFLQRFRAAQQADQERQQREGRGGRRPPPDCLDAMKFEAIKAKLNLTRDIVEFDGGLQALRIGEVLVLGRIEDLPEPRAQKDSARQRGTNAEAKIAMLCQQFIEQYAQRWFHLPSEQPDGYNLFGSITFSCHHNGWIGSDQLRRRYPNFLIVKGRTRYQPIVCSDRELPGTCVENRVVLDSHVGNWAGVARKTSAIAQALNAAQLSSLPLHGSEKVSRWLSDQPLIAEPAKQRPNSQLNGRPAHQATAQVPEAAVKGGRETPTVGSLSSTNQRRFDDADDCDNASDTTLGASVHCVPPRIAFGQPTRWFFFFTFITLELVGSAAAQ